MIDELDSLGLEAPLHPAPGVPGVLELQHRFHDFYEVGREKVREYARAVQDYHPAHWDEGAAEELGHENLVAPLTFISLVGLSKMFGEVAGGYDLSRVLHTEQVMEYHQAITVGDRLTCDCSVHSFRQMAGTDIVCLKALVHNQRGELLLTTYTTVVARPGDDVDDVMMNTAKRVMMHSTHL